MTSTPKAASLEELKLRNASLHDAGRIALETVNRYQANLKKIGALVRSIDHASALQSDQENAICALNDAVNATTLEVEEDIVMLIASVLRGNGVGESVSCPAHVLH